MAYIIVGLIVWTALGFIVWSFITVGGRYRHPITEDEAERAASMAEANCAWPIAVERDRASFHHVSGPTR